MSALLLIYELLSTTFSISAQNYQTQKPTLATMDIPNNPCIEVETENGAVIIPLHEDLILSVDPEYQEIIMQIPAGLL